VTPYRVEGQIKTVKPSDVEMWTGLGWVVVGSYQDTNIRAIPELIDALPGQVLNHNTSYTDANGLWQPVPLGKMTVSRFVPENITYFVLQKDPESVIGDLARQIADRDKKLAAIDEEHRKKLTEAQKEHAKKLADVEAEHKAATGLLKKALKEAEEALKLATSGSEVESLKKTVQTLKSDCDRLHSELEDSRRELFGVRAVDLSDDVAAE